MTPLHNQKTWNSSKVLVSKPALFKKKKKKKKKNCRPKEPRRARPKVIAPDPNPLKEALCWDHHSES